MEKLLSSHKNLSKNILLLYIFFSIIIFSININPEQITLSELEKTYSQIISANEDICFNYLLQFDLNDTSDIDSTTLKSSYIHISSKSENNKAQIMFSSSKECPTISKAEKYSYKYSDNSQLFIHYPIVDSFYITIKCLSYPCDLTLYTKIEKDYANLDTLEADSYSYFVTREEKINKMAFKIPSSLNKTYPNDASHLLTISVSHLGDAEFTQLYLVNDNKKTVINENIYKAQLDLIFSFVEENLIAKASESSFYVLEIESTEYQFVSISVKASIYNNNKLYSEIVPNSLSKYSYLNYSLIPIEEECFTLNEQYLNDKVLDDDFLIASIEYLSNPIVAYLKYDDNDQIPKETMDLSQRTINLIIEKKSNKYPSICVNNEKKASSFKLEVSHISQTNNNIDIYNPLSSGFFYSKILPKDTLAVYTHNSDIHYLEKITFYLKVIKGNPKLYIVPCDTYPICYSTVSELEGNNEVIKPSQIENIYSYTYDTNGHREDLSPYGPTQNLLYVHCPKGGQDQYCQYEVMIASNLDEISLLPNNRFYSSLLKDESDLFNIHIPKGNGNIKKIRIISNSTEESEIVTYEENMENLAMNVKVIQGNKICEFIPISWNDNEYDIVFDVKALKNVRYFIEYTLISEEEENVFNLHNLTFEAIKNINTINSFPIKIFSELPFTKQNNNYNFKDLLFNCYFQLLNSEKNNVINYFDEIEIKATIINSNELNKIIETDLDEEYLKTSLNKKFDKSTKSIILNINTDFLNKYKDNEKLILYMSIYSANNLIKENIIFSGKLFLFYKNNIDFVLPPNNYINDNLIVNGNYNYNLYHLKLENEEKNKYLVEFSSNYELDNKDLYISFLDYNNINNIKPENYLTNSTNVNFTESKVKLGTLHHFEFTLKDNSIKDVILCVATKLKANKGGLSSINYIFKYSTFSKSEYNNIKTFNFNQVIANSNNNDKTNLKYKTLKAKSSDNKETNVFGEISIRKILKNDRLNNEKLDTIAIIESKYELINTTVEGGNEELTISIPLINTKKEYHSVIINSLVFNQKFVFNTIPEGFIAEQNEKNENKKGKANVLAVVLICSGVFIVLIIIIALIMNYKNKNQSLKEDVMKTSFEKSGILEGLNDPKKE